MKSRKYTQSYVTIIAEMTRKSATERTLFTAERRKPKRRKKKKNKKNQSLRITADPYQSFIHEKTQP